MASIRQLATCLELGDDFSLLRDFFGYQRVPMRISLLRQVRLLQGHHVPLNIIRTGFDALSASEREAAERELDFAVAYARNLYAPVDCGIGRVQHYFIPVADAKGHEDIGGDGEADDLTDAWSVDNDAIDVFFVLTYSGAIGSSPKPPGSCDKDDKGAGVVLDIWERADITGAALAHEVGHYLGLDHVDDEGNLMHEKDKGGRALTPDQAETMRKHCFVVPGCEV